MINKATFYINDSPTTITLIPINSEIYDYDNPKVVTHTYETNGEFICIRQYKNKKNNFNIKLKEKRLLLIL